MHRLAKGYDWRARSSEQWNNLSRHGRWAKNVYVVTIRNDDSAVAKERLEGQEGEGGGGQEAERRRTGPQGGIPDECHIVNVLHVWSCL